MDTEKTHGDSDQPPQQESLSQRAVELLKIGLESTLATHSVKHPGFPFASVMPYALSPSGRPIFLISSMAIHTKNLLANPRASLLVAASDSGDRLAGSRVTLIGEVSRIDRENSDVHRKVYLEKHPSAGQWADFGDFSFFEMAIEDIYIVAGFGAMGWVQPQDYFGQFSQ